MNEVKSIGAGVFYPPQSRARYAVINVVVAVAIAVAAYYTDILLPTVLTRVHSWTVVVQIEPLSVAPKATYRTAKSSTPVVAFPLSANKLNAPAKISPQSRRGRPGLYVGRAQETAFNIFEYTFARAIG